ncbi:MAG: methylmalonyl-CoA mutase [bacterium]|nr:methylmalonyl-CoA mutase [bacterium]
MYSPQNKVRVVTATSLFDGHDASINIMRRILQASGAEVIHLGHNRSALDVATAAVAEDAQAVAVTSYQGGHMEFYRYLRRLLDERGGQEVKLFGGGGGTILPEEGAQLLAEGTARIYSPDDGRRLGLQGMIDEILEASDQPRGETVSDLPETLSVPDSQPLARFISAVENHGTDIPPQLLAAAEASDTLVVGITGTGGSGKSSLVDELVRRFINDFPDRSIGLVSVDPTRRRSGGALLGDRIRMNSATHPRVFMRSMATREPNRAISPHVMDAVALIKAAGYDLVILESSGIGQSDTEIVDLADISVYVMTPEYGAPSQLEKIDMLDFADLIVINKFDRRGAHDARRDVIKQYRRNKTAFEVDEAEIPVYGSIASHFNDPGTSRFYEALMGEVNERSNRDFPAQKRSGESDAELIIPSGRTGYLGEIATAARDYNGAAAAQAELAETVEQLAYASAIDPDSAPIAAALEQARSELDPELVAQLGDWDATAETYRADTMSYQVRGRDIEVEQYSETLSHNRVPKVAFPRYRSAGDRAQWLLQENLPGRFPFTAGVFPFRRTQEDPTRMFAGEGTPEQTNRRFHYLSAGMPAKRLSTAFDSVTLYGNDPDPRPDIFGKVGNSGVSIATLDDAKKLYSGFDLLDPATSVSMTINGPAPMMLAFFMNVAVDQQCELYIREVGLEDEVEAKIAAIFGERSQPRPSYHGEIPAGHNGLGLMLLGVNGGDVLPADVYSDIRQRTLQTVRGTIQADILKEDQAQNTCIFSTEFALRMQGDIQEFFVDNGVRNFYSVSISGYHMAEAGANPITQLAFTLANGFTFVEYFRARGMDVDSYAPNLSFFFSNGVDPEYAVIGRVARRIWAKAMRDVYGANEGSQKLKYHIQTSGRSLHAQEISFNDIRTTLQALYAIYDNANSLHTNAYDEAVTTPTEESVRRALAIQLIINKELGLNRTENTLQGSFIIDELTDLVEEAVLQEFERISDRGGVLGAMERMYQRTKIQEESLYYERLKESGELPIVGVNTFLSAEGSPFVVPDTLIRSTDADKQGQVAAVTALREHFKSEASSALEELQRVALSGENTFAALIEAAKVSSLGQMADALYNVGGQYRRNM